MAPFNLNILVAQVMLPLSLSLQGSIVTREDFMNTILCEAVFVCNFDEAALLGMCRARVSVIVPWVF
jgi:hypothetical protein